MVYLIKKNIEHEAENLWQGKGADICFLQENISKFIEIVSTKCVEGFGDGIEFPLQYLMDATDHFKEAIKKRDDYLLADCLYYEWREIIIVFIELCEALEK